jgi:hypothetical protein
VILAYVYENKTQDRPEKYVSVCSDSQVALKALQATKTTSPLVSQRQKTLNVTSTCHTVGSTWSLDMLGYKKMKSPTIS